MSQSIAEELARVPMSPNLMATLTRAADYARQQGHGRVTLEHVLLALTEDSDAALILQASQVAAEPLNADVTTHLTSLEPSGGNGQIAVAPELKRVLEAAAAAAQQGRRQVNGAIVLAAIVGEGKSTAAQMLRAQGLTFEHAIKALQRSSRPQTTKPATQPQRPAATAVASEAQASQAESRADLPPPAVVPPPQPDLPIVASGLPQPPFARATPPPLTPPPAPAPVASSLPIYETEVSAADRNAQRTEPDWAPAELEAAPTQAAPPRPQPPPALPTATGAHAQPPTLPAAAPLPPPAPPMPPAMPTPSTTVTSAIEPSWQPAPLPRDEPPPEPPSRSVQRNRPPEPPTYSRQPAPAYEPTYEAGPANTYYQQQPQLPPESPYASNQGYGHSVDQHSGSADVPWQPEPSYAPPPGPSHPVSQDYATASDNAGYSQETEPRRGPALPALVDVHSDAPPAASGQLIENIPRTMRVDVPVTVEVRLVGTSEGGHDQVSQATRAMSVRLSASDGGYTVESLTPETQWIEGGPRPQGQAVARWRWMVVPQSSGRRNLQLAVSTRWISADGISDDIPMPAQQVTVSVRRRYGKSLGRIIGWLVAVGTGAALVLFGGGVWKILLAVLKPWMGG